MKKNASNSIPEGLIYIGLLGLVIVLISLAGCNQPVAEDQATELFPEESGKIRRESENQASPLSLLRIHVRMGRMTIGGPNISSVEPGGYCFANQYERPFSAYEMVYQRTWIFWKRESVPPETGQCSKLIPSVPRPANKYIYLWN